jgi:galactonate dehydratase
MNLIPYRKRPVKEIAMKITRVEPIFCDGGWCAWTYVKIQTDAGVTGYGECTDWGNPIGVAGCIRDLERVLLGKDPLANGKLYGDMYWLTKQSPGGVAQKAMAGIDVALWDIKGKALGVPVYTLLGGPVRDRIRLYWSHCSTYRARYSELLGTPPLKTMQDITNLSREAVSRGYTALKTNIVVPGEPAHVIGSQDSNLSSETLAATVNLIRTFREAVGDKVDIGLDVNFNFRTEGFIKIARALEPFNLMWLELDTYDPEALLQVKEASHIPICSAENLFTMRGYKPFLDRHAMDIAMIDISWNGLSEGMRIAALADINEIMVAPHNFYSHLSTFACTHFCATVPNMKIMEIDVDSAPWRDDIVTDLPVIEKGYIKISQKPGLGTELNEKEIAKHPWPK